MFAPSLYALSPDDIRRYLALLETVSLGAMLTPRVQQVYNRAAPALDTVRQTLSSAVKRVAGRDVPVLDHEIHQLDVIPLPDRVKQREKELEHYSAEHLRERLRSELRRRLPLPRSLPRLAGEVSRMAGSTPPDDAALVRAAALVAARFYRFKEPEALSTARLVKLVHNRLLEDSLVQAARKFKKMCAEEREEAERRIQRQLDELDPEAVEALCTALEVDTLTGPALTAALVRGGSLTALVSAFEAAGFGGYVALTAIVHAIFTTALGITLPFAVYTGLSSVAAFLTGPIGIALLGGSIVWAAQHGSSAALNAQLMARFTSLIRVTCGPKDPPPFDLEEGGRAAREQLREWADAVLSVPKVRSYLVSAEAFLASFEEADTLHAELSPFVITYLKSVEAYLGERCTELAGSRPVRISRDRRRRWFTGVVDYRRQTLGSFAYLIEDNPEIFLAVPAHASSVGHAIQQYAQRVRNARAHQHEVLDWGEVEQVRSATYVLLVRLAGELRPSSLGALRSP